MKIFNAKIHFFNKKAGKHIRASQKHPLYTNLANGSFFFASLILIALCAIIVIGLIYYIKTDNSRSGKTLRPWRPICHSDKFGSNEVTDSIISEGETFLSYLQYKDKSSYMVYHELAVDREWP